MDIKFLMEHVVSTALLLTWQKFLLLLMLLASCSGQSTYYVTPTTDTPCPGDPEPCHTLSEYVAGQYFDNLPVNTTMEFLPGNHTLEQTISLTNLTWLTLHGDSSSLPEITARIACTWPARFVFTNITELHISAMAFVSCGHHNSAVVSIMLVQQSDISDCTFKNSSNTINDYESLQPDMRGVVLFVEHSTLTLTGNTFQNNSADIRGAQVNEHNIILRTFGVLFAWSSALNLTENTFQNNSVHFQGGAHSEQGGDIIAFGGALSVVYSTISLTKNTFQKNSAVFAAGGAILVLHSFVSLTKNIFQYNSAFLGGALVVGHSTLNLSGNTFQNNSAYYVGGALAVQNSTLDLTGNTFQSNSAGSTGALAIVDSTLSLTGNTFQYNSASDSGGALHAVNSTLNVTGNTFQNNTVHGRALFEPGSFNDIILVYGGALQVLYSTLSLTKNTFQYNYASIGGVLAASILSTLNLTGNTFQYNSARYYGGVLSVESSALNLIENTVQNNSAEYGGVLHVQESTVNLTGNTFQYNSANDGGTLHINASTINLTGNTFHNNSAVNSGGTQYVIGSILHFKGNKFQKSYAAFGGTLHMDLSSVTFTEDSFTDSYAQLGGAILATGNSTVKMYNITIENNKAQYGGGMAAFDSRLEVFENSFFENNRASYGGGLYVHNTDFHGRAVLTKNFATEGGGGIYASSSTFFLMGDITIITNNSAMDGGGLLLSSDSKLLFQPGIAIHLISNSAKSTGGAIKVEESNPLVYCITTERNIFASCFFQIQQEKKSLAFISRRYFKAMINSLNVRMYFDNNTAVEAGNDLYGGSVDHCTVNSFEFNPFHPGPRAISGFVFDVISEDKPAISSDPLYICTCRYGIVNCTSSYHLEPVFPGGTLEVPVIARGQRNVKTTAVIEVTDTSNNISINNLEYFQSIDKSCNTLKYTVHSRAIGTTQEMILYAQGPCSPTQSETNTLTVTVNIKNCPPGFQLSTNTSTCVCAERLQRFTNTCLVDSTTVLRERNAEFWVGYDSDNESRGLILHPHCPFDYCTSEETYLAVDDSDKQCSYNRSGLLCGRCSENLSLALGSSRCLQCSNSYLSLLAVFAFAGIVLVLLLLVLRLTVAAGTINGLIFYANIIAVNSAIFLQPQTTNVPTRLMANVLSVFIAWLNLDLGIETCFYNGMDAYIKTWMQFAFPLYVWALVGMVIVGSHYSGRVARIFGSNPIAVLATLFLLSYAKLLRTAIAALSYTSLEYPNNSQIAVWLYDGNIRYLSSKHIPLFTATMVCLIFLFLPYTMLLIFSQWLQAKSELKIFSRINSRYVKPFLDAYHAPYANKHRYWTGLMLLLRLVLFLISAVNALGDPSVNLLAIASITAAILTLPTILGSRIYKTCSLGLLETSFILNLTILAVATLYTRLTGGNQNATTFTSVGIAFATFTGIVIYHSAQQLKGTRLWRYSLRHDDERVPKTDLHAHSGSMSEDPPDRVFTSGSAPTLTVVNVYELREPCMETD